MKKFLIAFIATALSGVALADTFTLITPRGGMQSAPGYYCVLNGTTITCVQAQANYYASAGSTSQTPCPAGLKSPAGSPDASYCNAGKNAKEN
jgi:hypothetical protein